MDDSVLPYFMEYMQKQNATNLLNFWLTAETFRLSTINRLRINSISRLKSSKGENVNASPSGDTSGTMSDSSHLYSLGNSLDQPYTSSKTADQSCTLDDDNNEFGDFTGYDQEQFTAADSTSKDASNMLLLCNNCGRLINPSSSKKDVCNQCGHCIGHKQTIDSTVTSGYSKQQIGFNSSLENGINQIDSSNQSKVDIQRSTDHINNETRTQEGAPSSKVTFDLTLDFEHEERGFCRRRTRSIVIDAVSIYSKYISLEAANPIGLEESVRRQIESKLHDHYNFNFG